MLLRYLNLDSYSLQQCDISFLAKVTFIKDVWVFNCTEGCQVDIVHQNFKLNNLTKIIVTNLHISNVSGLLGLLSSLNLIGRTRSIHIYGPLYLKHYLDLGKKYSRTSFNYVVYLHVIKTGLMINYYGCRIYTCFTAVSYAFMIVQSEQYGTFFLNKAKSNRLMPGPLYGKLKRGRNFLLPDGFLLNGSSLTSRSMIGLCFSILRHSFCNRLSAETIIKSRVVLIV